jgi:hypothetical protein
VKLNNIIRKKNIYYLNSFFSILYQFLTIKINYINLVHIKYFTINKKKKTYVES